MTNINDLPINHIVNPGTKHVACILLVDTSGSMYGAPIQELNEGLRVFQNSLGEDVFARGCVDVSIVEFNSSVNVVVPFTPAMEYTVPNLQAGGSTAMNEAIITALDLVEQRKEQYRLEGVSYWRPWMFLLTDGVPTDPELSGDALNRLQEALQKKKVTFFPMGIGSGADLSLLKRYTENGTGVVLAADQKSFQKAFQWLSTSISIIGGSKPDMDTAVVPPPTDYGMVIPI